ncbi:hypothetical protein EDB87DRAFT_537906 [Lactarius vividus]|nr:hypothetical protein EDB87DRAFT_537906 [Lactarius vividus]
MATVRSLLLSASFPRAKKKRSVRKCLFASVGPVNLFRLLFDSTQDFSHRDNHIISDRSAFCVIDNLFYLVSNFILLCRSFGGVICGLLEARHMN